MFYKVNKDSNLVIQSEKPAEVKPTKQLSIENMLKKWTNDTLLCEVCDTELKRINGEKVCPECPFWSLNEMKKFWRMCKWIQVEEVITN